MCYSRVKHKVFKKGDKMFEIDIDTDGAVAAAAYKAVAKGGSELLPLFIVLAVLGSAIAIVCIISFI